MPANQNPIFTATPDVQWGAAPVTTANTTKDLTSGTSTLVFTAGANGAYLTKLIARPLGTNATAGVLRVFLNNGSTTGTGANNALIAELSIPATTLSETTAQAPYEIPFNFAIPAGFKVYVTFSQTAAAGFEVTVFGGQY